MGPLFSLLFSESGLVLSQRTSSPAVRGTRIGGALSHEETRDEMEFEPRRRHNYSCLLGHQTTVTFHAQAVPPAEWDCAVCPSKARHEDHVGDEPVVAVKTGKTHMEQLRSRRTDEELESLLAEAQSNYRKFGKSF